MVNKELAPKPQGDSFARRAFANTQKQPQHRPIYRLAPIFSIPSGLPRLRVAGLSGGLDWCGLVWHHRPIRGASPKRGLCRTHQPGASRILIPLQGNIYALGGQPPPPSTYGENSCSYFATTQIRQGGENIVPRISGKSFFDR